jgi:hypothetical protein
MGQYDGVIAFLENEARALRARIADIESRNYPPGVTTDGSARPEWELLRDQAKDKLREVEMHLRTLRGA